MREIRLYTPNALASGHSVVLDDVAANHLARVLRARVGDKVVLFNGDGLDWAGTVAAIDKRAVTVDVLECIPRANESPLQTHLGLCLSKGDRFDWAIQKATELGVSEITPLFSDRVELKLPQERLTKKLRHWQQVVVSACEQCGRARVPPMNAPVALTDWVTSVDGDLKLVLHHHQEASLPDTAPTSVALLIGPEGGLEEKEVDLATAAGFQRLRLGPRVMRTETAPMAALAILGSRWGDL